MASTGWWHLTQPSEAFPAGVATIRMARRASYTRSRDRNRNPAWTTRSGCGALRARKEYIAARSWAVGDSRQARSGGRGSARGRGPSYGWGVYRWLTVSVEATEAGAGDASMRASSIA